MSHQARDLAERRGGGAPNAVVAREVGRAAILRRGRAVAALLAMVVAAAVATAMLNLYGDVQAKLRREFRNYGANIILVGKNSASLPRGTLAQVDAILHGRGVAAPFGMIVGRTGSGQPIVVAGTEFDRVQKLDRWWSVSQWPGEIPTSRAQHAREMGHPESSQ